MVKKIFVGQVMGVNLNPTNRLDPDYAILTTELISSVCVSVGHENTKETCSIHVN